MRQFQYVHIKRQSNSIYEHKAATEKLQQKIVKQIWLK